MTAVEALAQAHGQRFYGKRFAVPPAAFTIASDFGARFARGIFKESSAFARVLNSLEPIRGDYEQAQRCARRRYGPLIAALEIPGEVGIVDLTSALTALAAADQARLAQLRRRLRAQARNGDTQAAALEGYLHLLLDLLQGEELRRMLLEIRALVHAQARGDELASLAVQRTDPRAAARLRRPLRGEQDPVRTRRCSRAPNDVSSLPLCPEVAA